MIEEFCFPRITNSVEINSITNFINAKLYSKKFLNENFLNVQFTENECKLHVKCSVANTMIFNVKTVSSVDSEN